MLNLCARWVLLGGCAAAGAGTADAHLRIGLAPAAEVETDRLRLSDLLPRAAPEAMRTAAAAVDLGHAPQPGKRRVLDRSFILTRLTPRPELRDALDVPASVTVSRAHRRIGPAEVHPVIETALRDAQCAELLPLAIGSLTMPDAIRSADPDPRVEVLGFEADPLRAAIRVRLRAGSGGAPPFYVTFPFGGAHATLAEHADNATLAEHADDACPLLTSERVRIAAAPVEASPGTVAPDSPILVRTGQPATLRAIGRGMQMVVPVVPLQHGRLGDEIRVRNPENQSVILGTVVAPNLLERSF